MSVRAAAVLVIVLLWITPCGAARRLNLLGAPLFESGALMLMAQEDVFARLGYETHFIPWRSPDQYRAMLLSGQADILVISALEYTRLRKALPDLNLLFSVAGTPLWLLGSAGDIRLEELRGKRLALPFRGDMPELTLRLLLRNSPVNMADVRLVSGGGAVSSAQLVMTGDADFVMIAEPLAAMMVNLSHAQNRGRPLHYALDLNRLWHQRNPQGPPLLLSHIVARDLPKAVSELFQRLYPAYVEHCRNRPRQCAALFCHYFPSLSQSEVERFLATTPLRILPAAEIKAPLCRFLDLVEEASDEAL